MRVCDDLICDIYGLSVQIPFSLNATKILTHFCWVRFVCLTLCNIHLLFSVFALYFPNCKQMTLHSCATVSVCGLVISWKPQSVCLVAYPTDHKPSHLPTVTFLQFTVCATEWHMRQVFLNVDVYNENHQLCNDLISQAYHTMTCR